MARFANGRQVGMDLSIYGLPGARQRIFSWSVVKRLFCLSDRPKPLCSLVSCLLHEKGYKKGRARDYFYFDNIYDDCLTIFGLIGLAMSARRDPVRYSISARPRRSRSLGRNAFLEMLAGEAQVAVGYMYKEDNYPRDQNRLVVRG